MRVTSGTHLGPYEVLSALGAGGMGEVYRARDTKLGRDVAIKVLPDSLATDPERRARFQREAHLLASLNHPHIAAIYGFEDSGSVHALVLELVEGETLADRIARGPLPVDDALRIATQIADALDAAHDQGIIHRDLKPANIKVTPDGVVKVLDFGLAKLNAPPPDVAGASSGRSMSPTITTPAMMTGIGAILGTAAYMSPEQAKGREADKRSDVWAFGCVLFEMLTGRRAFGGDDVGDVYAAVLRGDPDWTAWPADAPPGVRAVVRRCLEKDRRRRLGDVASALAIAGDVADTGREAVAGRVARSSRRTLAFVGGAAALIAAAGVGTLAWVTRQAPPQVSRLMIAPAAQQAVAISGEGRNVAISRDGTRIAYVGADGTLWVRSIDELEPAALVRNDNPVAPFFSPDGQWVGYFPSNSALRKVSVAGGPTVVLTTTDAGQPRGGAWAEDGTVVFATTNRSTGLQITPPGTTTPRILTTPDRQRGEAEHLWPEFLPGAQAILFTILTTTGADNTQLAVFDRRTGRYKVIVAGGSHAHYVSTGHLVYVAAGGLRAIPFDLDRLETTGRSTAVVPSVLPVPDGSGDFDISANGTLAYVPDTGATATGALRELVWVGRDGALEVVRGLSPRRYLYPRLSPDGTRALLDIRDTDNDIWLWDLQRNSLTNVTRNPALDRFPVWMPDGKRFVFVSDRDGGRSVIYRQSVDGSGEPEPISEPTAEQQTPTTVTRDGTQLIFDRRVDGNDDLWVLALDGSRKVTRLVRTPSAELRAVLSPDNRWLAYHSDESGHFEVYVRPFPMVDGGKATVSTAGGIQPAWGPGGNELLFLAPDGALMHVQVRAGQHWLASPPAVRASGLRSIGSTTAAATFDMARDGRVLMVQSVAGPDAAASAPLGIVIVQHWFEELKKLVAGR